MHRYEELERLYYKKLFIKFFLFFSLIFVIVGSFFLISKKKVIKQVEINKSKKVVNKPKIIINKQDKEVKKVKKEKIHIQELNFVLPDIKTEKQLQIKTKPKIINNENTNNKNNKNINIIENQANIPQLISEYNKNHNYDLAILIAKMYLNQNKLKQAQLWALKANSQDPSIADSWIVMSDILIKEKNYKKAKEVLKVYINSYGSNDIIEEKLRSLNDK